MHGASNGRVSRSAPTVLSVTPLTSPNKSATLRYSPSASQSSAKVSKRLAGVSKRNARLTSSFF